MSIDLGCGLVRPGGEGPEPPFLVFEASRNHFEGGAASLCRAGCSLTSLFAHFRRHSRRLASCGGEPALNPVERRPYSQFGFPSLAWKIMEQNLLLNPSELHDCPCSVNRPPHPNSHISEPGLAENDIVLTRARLTKEQLPELQP